jgi:hypothetical protein
MPAGRARRRRLLGSLAILLAAAAPVTLLQGPDATSAAHYALVRALSTGTPAIDDTYLVVSEDEVTNDVLFLDEHVYANKAPGLAFVTLPAYVLLDRLGVRTEGEATRMIWALGLWSVFLPALGALALVRLLGERVAPGYGAATAVMLATGTLMLPFGSLFFSHPLSAFLCFAAFAILWLERERPPAMRLLAAAGVVIGYGVTTEYPNIIAALVLGAYAIARGDVARRAGAYAVGVAVGAAPLLAYHLWAFGSIARVPYDGTVSGPPLADAFHGPSVSAFASVLFSRRGLLVIMPVLALGLAGIAALYRRGRRVEALTIAALALSYLLFVSSFFDPFGAVSLPRYLITILPFLAVPLALAIQAVPLTAWTLAAGSALVMVVITSTAPFIWFDGNVVERFTSGEFVATVSQLAGFEGWFDIVPFFALVAGALGCALIATSAHATVADARTAAAGVLGWLVVASAANDLLFIAGFGRIVGALLTFALVTAVVLAVAAVHLDGWRGFAAFPFLAAAALPRLSDDADPLLIAAALAGTLLVERRRIVALLAGARAGRRSRPLPS